MTYYVVYYCDVLSKYKVVASNLSLAEAESEVKKLYDKKKGDRTKLHCCQYFIQKTE